MANVRKRISELTALNSASLDTTIVGVDNGTTYKIELDTLADAVTSRVNILDRDRLNLLESVTSSFETKGRSVISSSAQITTLGFVSSSIDISSLNSFTSSQSTLNTAFTNGINARLQTSSFDTFSQSVDSRLIAATNEQDLSYLATTGSNTFIGDQTMSGSIIPAVSGSYDLGSITNPWRHIYVNTGSIFLVKDAQIVKILNTNTIVTTTDIASGSVNLATTLPTGVISGSTQISDLGFVTGSYTTINSFNSLTQSFNSISQSFTTISSSVGGVDFSGVVSSSAQITSFGFVSGSYLTSLSGAISSSEQVLGNSGVYSSSAQINGNIYSAGSSVTIQDLLIGAGTTFGKVTTDGNKYISVMPTYNVESARFWPNGNVTIQNAGTYVDNGYRLEVSGSTKIVGSFDVTDGITGSTNFNTIVNKPTLISSSAQITAFGFVSSSASVPAGTISGSSQLTASYDTRYTLSGSVVSGTTPAGTISGSSQLTSSFDGRYTQTGSFNTLTASFNSFTASAQSVTTGSNSFNGTQTITGSLIITTGSFVGSQILANTSSLYLTSGSNMYVQNNGVVEITGSLKVNGITRFETVGGDEGGEIEFGVPQTNTTLSTRVVQDIWQNRLRIFDGNTKGVFIDLSKAPIGVAGEITWKSSGYVDAGTFVQLDNIKASVTTSGNRGLSIGAVSTNFSANIGGTFSNSAGAGGNSTQNIAYTTTASTSVFGWNFIAEGDTSTYIINDKTNSRMYRITMMIGPAYLGNFISIERLH